MRLLLGWRILISVARPMATPMLACLAEESVETLVAR
jgi:hypothetical protein